jgi:hypothetical protein
MTTVRTKRPSASCRWRVGGKLHWAVLVLLVSAAPAAAQSGPVHWNHAGSMPPGAIGRQRLLRGGPLSGYYQAVEIRAPQGARIAPALEGSFAEPQTTSLLVGLQIGPVYRFRVTEIPDHPGLEVFPTVEMVDRTYPPPGKALRFPVPIQLTEDELLMAAEGKFVTRIIYIEDPQLAIPIREKQASDTRWIEAAPGSDPLVTADNLGRPIAILRMGGRVPEGNEIDPAFTFGCPPMLIHVRPTPAAPGEVMLTPHETPIIETPVIQQ